MPSSVDRELHARLVALLPEIVRQVLVPGFETQAKGNDGLDFVTSVDLAMQTRLERALVALLPESLVKGEEGFIDLPDERADRPVWIIDPIDGTANFVAGLPCYAVSVALAIDRRTILSAVYDIPQGTIYSALAGQGAFVNGAPLRPRCHQAKLAVLSSGLLGDLTRNAPETLAGLLVNFKLRNFGSQALHLCYAAAGHLLLVASREAKGWDDLAGELIVREAGLDYGHYHGKETPPIGRDQYSLCARSDLFETYAKALARSLPRTAVGSGGSEVSS